MTKKVKSILASSVSAFWSELPIGVRLSGKALAYAPVFAKSIKIGLLFPDLDLALPGIGIGGHRWAVTHSAAAAWLTKSSLLAIDQLVESSSVRQAVREITAVSGAGFSVGLSIHLLKDAFIDNSQSIRFKIPFVGGPGTIIQGTYVDDDTWLAGNGLYALRVAADILLLGFGDDVTEVRSSFDRWRNQQSVIAEINRSMKAAMQESRELSVSLHRQIPTDCEDAQVPEWVRSV